MEEAAASTVQGIPKPAPRRLISKTGVQTEIAFHHQAPNHREYDKYKEEEHDNDTKDPSASSNGQWLKRKWFVENKSVGNDQTKTDFYNCS